MGLAPKIPNISQILIIPFLSMHYNVKSSNALLHTLLVCINSYRKPVLRYKHSVLYICHLDTLYLHEQGTWGSVVILCTCHLDTLYLHEQGTWGSVVILCTCHLDTLYLYEQCTWGSVVIFSKPKRAREQRSFRKHCPRVKVKLSA